MKTKDRAAFPRKVHTLNNTSNICHSHEKKENEQKKQLYETKNHIENKPNKGQSQKANHL